MLKNYFKIALRHLVKNRLFTFLNIAGLSVGLAAGLLMLLWAQDELTYDNFHADTDRIYREVSHFNSGGSIESWRGSPGPHALVALQEIPAVEKAVRVGAAGAPIFKYKEQKNVEKEGVFVDSSFFEVFKTNLIAGNAARPFENSESIVLTESFAKKYFGKEEAVGKVVEIAETKSVVSAVIRDFPSNSIFQFEYFRNFELLKKQFKGNDLWKTLESDWGDFNYYTYLKLRPGASPEAVGKKLGEIHHAHNKFDLGSWYTLQSLLDLHLVEADGSTPGKQTVNILGLAAILLILIACINYMNLSTAQATGRAREVGLRKVIGAEKSQLFAQFMLETGLVFVVSFVLSLTIAHLMLPIYNDLADKNLALDFSKPAILGLFGGTMLLTLLLSGLYPSLVLSAFQPIETLKGKLSGRGGGATFRKALVVSQFVFSIGLMISMLVIGRQLSFIRSKNLGFDRQNVFSFSLSEDAFKHRDALRKELAEQPGVLSVTTASSDILELGSTTGDTDWDGKTTDQNVIVSPISIAPDFMPFFKMEMVAGEGFTGNKSDSTRFLLNESAVKRLGLTEPVVGKRFKLWQTNGIVAGVVKDFHFQSLREKIGPAVFLNRPDWHGQIYVKTTGQDAAKAIAAAGQIWKKHESTYPFDYAFMDDTFDKMYRSEQRIGTLFNAFGVLAIFISCLGLFGLSAFTVAKRVKEIGIRKVLGASVQEITLLLATDFLTLVAVAIVIATPIAYYFMKNWLADFAYRIEMQWWMFALAGTAAVGIAFLTVGFQSVKAALANPVKSLRSE